MSTKSGTIAWVKHRWQEHVGPSRRAALGAIILVVLTTLLMTQSAPKGAPQMSVIAAFGKALEGGDHARVLAMLSDDVVLHSPAVIETEYSGRELVGGIVGFAMRTIEGVTVTDELRGEGGESHALLIEGRIGSQRLQGCVYLHTDDGGLINEVTFMLRPFHAVQAFVTAMGAMGAQPALDLESGGR